MVIETQIEDPSFEQIINLKDSPVFLKVAYYTHPDRLLGNAKTYYDILKKHKLLGSEDGIIYFDTRSNLAPIKTKQMNVRNLLQSFLLEDCFLGVLCDPDTINQTESMIKRVREAYKKQLKKNIKTYAEDKLTLTSDDSELEVMVICSSYPSTYGEYSRSAKITQEVEEEPKLQIKLCYNLEKAPISQDTADSLEFCIVRFDADNFLKYISQYGQSYYDRIQTEKRGKNTEDKDTEFKKSKLEEGRSSENSEDFEKPETTENTE